MVFFYFFFSVSLSLLGCYFDVGKELFFFMFMLLFVFSIIVFCVCVKVWSVWREEMEFKKKRRNRVLHLWTRNDLRWGFKMWKLFYVADKKARDRWNKILGLWTRNDLRWGFTMWKLSYVAAKQAIDVVEKAVARCRRMRGGLVMLMSACNHHEQVLLGRRLWRWRWLTLAHAMAADAQREMAEAKTEMERLAKETAELRGQAAAAEKSVAETLSDKSKVVEEFIARIQLRELRSRERLSVRDMLGKVFFAWLRVCLSKKLSKSREQFRLDNVVSWVRFKKGAELRRIMWSWRAWAKQSKAERGIRLETLKFIWKRIEKDHVVKVCCFRYRVFFLMFVRESGYMW